MISDHDILEVLKVSGIGTAGVSYSFLGLPLSDVVAIMTGAYVFINLILTLPKLIRMFKKK